MRYLSAFLGFTPGYALAKGRRRHALRTLPCKNFGNNSVGDWHCKSSCCNASIGLSLAV